MEKYQLKIGDTIPLNLFYQYFDEQEELHYSPLEIISISIIGTMDPIDSSTEQLPPDILLPFETVRASFHAQGVAFSAESAFFYVSDPLQLNAFKKEMKSFGLQAKAPSAKYSYQGIALAVRDTIFRILASQLRQSIDTLQSFFPLIFIIVLFIGYITSFLLINSRQKEFALMRALGAGRGKCFLLFFLEQFLLIFLGELIGGGVAIVLFHKALMVLFAGNIFLFSYLLGCVVALWRMEKTSITEALFCSE
jgi:ABC-type antimicrobial peptide transport system permease subunit